MPGAEPVGPASPFESSPVSLDLTAPARPAPGWTDAAAAGTPIRAVHLTELRAAVAALE